MTRAMTTWPPLPRVLDPAVYRRRAAAVFRKAAEESEKPFSRAYWHGLAFLVELTGYPRAFTTGAVVTTTARGRVSLKLMAHEYAHTQGIHHPGLWEVGYWFDVRAAHPLRWSDHDGLQAKARAWLVHGKPPPPEDAPAGEVA